MKGAGRVGNDPKEGDGPGEQFSERLLVDEFLEGGISEDGREREEVAPLPSETLC